MPLIPENHRLLDDGEQIQAGDVAYTWTTPECVELGWVTIPKDWVEDGHVGKVDEGHVPVARRLPPVEEQRTTILNACGGWLKFTALVLKHRANGMGNDFTARQIVDDLYREGQGSFHFQQHLVEAMAALVV